MAEPVEYRNKRGQSMWQPCTRDGDRLWLVGSYFMDELQWHRVWGQRDDLFIHMRPRLFRSRRRAERVAQREERRRERVARREERRRERVELDETYEEVVDRG